MSGGGGAPEGNWFAAVMGFLTERAQQAAPHSPSESKDRGARGAGTEEDWLFMPAVRALSNVFEFRKAKEMHLNAANASEDCESKFGMNLHVLTSGTLEHFYMGLDEYNGRPVGDNIEMQMKLEFSHDVFWTAKNAGLSIETSLKEEWEFVVNPIENKQYRGMCPVPGTTPAAGATEEAVGRNWRVVEEIGKFMTLDMTKKAKLTRPEVIAVRLYTGPSYVPINQGLRAGGRNRTDKNVGNFPVTCSVLNSAIRKLSKVTPIAKNRLLYRGLSGVILKGQSLRGFVELGFSSATPVKEVALEYTTHHEGLPTLFVIDVGQIDNGASLQDFSQFPAEEEVCLPPLSNFELVDDGQVIDGTCIFKVKLNVNLKARTLDELRGARKVAVQEFSRVLALDYQEMAGGRKCEKLLEITETEVDGPTPDYFNNNINFWHVHERLFTAYKLEIDQSAKAFAARASSLDNTKWRPKVKLLQRALNIIKRSTVGYKEAVAMSERVVEALPPDAKARELEEAEQSVVVGALQEHVELLIEAGGQANFKRAVEVADRVAAVVNKTRHKRQHNAANAAIAAASSKKSTSAAATVREEQPPQGQAAEAAEGEGDELGPPPTLERIMSRNEDLDLDVASALYWRARAYVQLKEWDKALPDVEEAVRIRTAVLGEHDEEVPKTLSLQGQIYFGKQKFAEALAVHEKARKLRVEVFGGDHLEVAASLSNIAKVLAELGRVPEAKANLKQALKIQRRELGRRHKYVAFTEEAMGKLLRQEECLGQAAVYFTEALATAEHLQDDNFSKRMKESIEALDVAKAAMRQKAMDCAAEAEGMPLAQWQKRIKLLRESVALIKRVSEGFADALEMSERVVKALPEEVSRQTLGEAGLAVATEALQENAELLIEKGGPDNCRCAVELAGRCVHARGGERGETQAQAEEKDLGLATALYWRARAHVQLKEWDKALPDVEEAVRIRTAVLGEHDEEVPKTLSLQGQIYFGKQKFAEALAVHEKARKLRVEVFGGDHLEVAASLSNIAKAYGKQKKLFEAKIALDEALHIQREHLGRRHQYVAFTEEAMGNLLRQEGRPEEAAQYFDMALTTARHLKDDGFAARLETALAAVQTEN